MVQLSEKYCSLGQAFNPSVYKMVFFGSAQGWSDQKGPSVYNISHNSCNDKTWHSCILPKGDLNNI